jgi:hypothetical protein
VPHLFLLMLAAAPPEAAEVPPLGHAAFVATAVGVSLGAGALSVYLGTRPQDAVVQATGRPQPLVSAAGFGLSLGLNFALMHLFVPWLSGLGDVDGSSADAALVRAEAWRHARWPLLASAAGLVATFVGAGLEQERFGRGQGVMLVGLGVMFFGTIVTDVLEAVGAWHGATRRSR